MIRHDITHLGIARGVVAATYEAHNGCHWEECTQDQVHGGVVAALSSELLEQARHLNFTDDHWLVGAGAGACGVQSSLNSTPSWETFMVCSSKAPAASAHNASLLLAFAAAAAPATAEVRWQWPTAPANHAPIPAKEPVTSKALTVQPLEAPPSHLLPVLVSNLVTWKRCLAVFLMSTVHMTGAAIAPMAAGAFPLPNNDGHF